jgi:hypothetical protein
MQLKILTGQKPNKEEGQQMMKNCRGVKKINMILAFIALDYFGFFEEACFYRVKFLMKVYCLPSYDYRSFSRTTADLFKWSKHG